MSYEMETRNRGEVRDWGFFSADTSRIRLGDAPAIELHQFCDYATESLIASVDKVLPAQRQEIAEVVQIMNSRVSDLKIRTDENIAAEFPSFANVRKTELAEGEAGNLRAQVGMIHIPRNISQEIKEAEEAGDLERASLLEEALVTAFNPSGVDIQDHFENPFKVVDTHIVVADLYDVDFQEFARFAVYVMHGGFIGWRRELGIPEYAHRGLQRLAEAFPSTEPPKA